jgi:hypothetical protein
MNESQCTTRPNKACMTPARRTAFQKNNLLESTTLTPTRGERE